MKKLIILFVTMLPFISAAQSDIYADYGFINRIEPYTATVITVSDDIICLEGLTLAAADSVRSGTIEWDGSNFRGYDGAAWNNFGYLSGSGANTQLVYWTGASSVSGTSEMVHDGSSLIITDAANGPLRIRRDEGTNGFGVGILFGLKDDADAWNTYGQIDAIIVDNTAASEDGKLRFNASEAGVITVKLGEWGHVNGLVLDQDQMYIKSTSDLKISTDGTLAIFENIVNNGDIELRGFSASAGVHAFYFDGSTNRVGIRNSTPTVAFDVTGDAFFSGYVETDEYLDFPTTLSADTGVIKQNGVRFIHSYNSTNIFVGTSSGNFTTTGTYNVGLGQYSLTSLTSGGSNFGLGYNGLNKTTSGAQNVGIGRNGLYSNTIGDNNIGIGYQVGFYNQEGSNNVLIGVQAGRGTSNHNKSGNIFIGHQAGYNETGDNKLYIENSDSGTPLIHGDFAADTLRINGDLKTSGTITEGTPTRLGAYIKEDSTLITTVVADTWKFLGGGANSKFTNIYATADIGFVGDTLQYTGTPAIYVHIEYGGNVKCNTASETVHITIFINDTQAEQFLGATFCKTQDEEYPIAGISNIVQVSTNDKIKIMIKSDSGTTITNDHFSITAHKIQ